VVRGRILIATSVAILLMASGCAGQGPDPAEPGAVEPGAEEAEGAASSADRDDAEVDGGSGEAELQVVATVAPIADLVSWVGGDRVEVSSLVPSGADSHTYEPRPGDITTLADADAYLGIGLDLNPAALALAEEQLDPDRVIALGERYLDTDALVLDHVHDEDGGHGHDDGGHSHDDGGHSHDDDGSDAAEAGPNPHVWTGLSQTAELLDGIAATLSELDPEGEGAYAENAATARGELEELDARIREAVETIPEQHRTLVVYHDAWSYFARDYGLEMVTAVQPDDFSDPSAAEVRDLIDLLRDEEVPALFGSEVFPSDVLDVIAEEAGAAYVADLADDVLPGEPGDEEHSYLGLMRRNATVIVEGLGGDASALTEG
jgi:ABC-type Zn uptake system ZnuABC Zn-binding protein ZnuA